MKLIYFALAGLLTLVGCATAQFAPSRIEATYPPRTTPEKIEMFRSSLPAKKYREIGAASVCCGSTEMLVEALRKKASDAGGDAIIAIELNATNGATATVIRYE